MGARFAILCPGQGGQHAGMFDLLRSDPTGAQVLADLDLDAHFLQPIGTILHDDSLLFSNRYAQPLIVAAGLAAWETMRRDLPEPALVAGYSVGEMTAYGVAGALPMAAMIGLAHLRAAAMDTAQRRGPAQGMMAVSGLPVAELVERLRGQEGWVAIETGFDTAIVGGSMAALQGLHDRMQLTGAKTGMLPVAIASHTPLMEEAVAPFAQALENSNFTEPQIPVLAGISGQLTTDRETSIATLVQQLTQPVRWSACMEACAEQRIAVALELGPGAALARMLGERHPDIECRSLSDFRSLAGALRWLQSRVA